MMSSLVQRTRRSSLSSPRNVQCLFSDQLSAFAVHSGVLPCPFCQHCGDVLLRGISVFLLHRAFLNELLSVPPVMFSRMFGYVSLSFALVAHLLRCLDGWR